MTGRLEKITEFISAYPAIEIITAFKIADNSFLGSIVVDVEGNKLPFDVVINVQYPFRCHETETIRFINKNLIEYNHVMADGHVCIHTIHSPDLKTKLHYDLNSLKEWIDKYYLKKEGDQHYEHIIVPPHKWNDENFCYLFTEVENEFTKGDHGFFKYSQIPSKGVHQGTKMNTYIVQGFAINKNIKECAWNSYYKQINNGKMGDGIYVFIDEPPVKNKRFIVNSWEDLNTSVTAVFMNFLFNVRKELQSEGPNTPLPLLIGYRLPNGEVHWQCALMDLQKFPLQSQKLAGKWYAASFEKKEITWAQTKNISYKYFFGRGTLNKELTEKNILIIGIGAIGSNLATTLTRGGCRSIALADYDIKEPENICRAEYSFVTGLTAKVAELAKALFGISPFVEVEPIEWFTDKIKYFVNKGFFERAESKFELQNYDLIFDCSTDDDVAYIIDALNPSSRVINLSVTNHAKELVCVGKPNLYEQMNAIYSTLTQDKVDLYNPTGCWSPTFKASFNDIALMVQFAIQQINECYEKGLEPGNFVLQKDNSNGTNIKLKQF